MRILWSSNTLWSSTGYGNQTALFLPRLAALGHQMGLFAWYGLEGGILNMGMQYGDQNFNIPVYPKYRDGYGNDMVGAHAQHFKADIVISLIDAWVLNAAEHQRDNIKWCPWFPIDMEPIPAAVLKPVADSFQPIVYSRFGERMAHDAGLDVRYVPHGVDTNVYTPLDKNEVRQKLGWPLDRFIVGMVAANKGTPSRKAYPQQLEAFANFSRKHPDVLLYLHTSKGENGEMGGVNLPELVEYLGITDKVLFCDQYANRLGFPAAHMNAVYNGMDVLLSASMGEGFGIPILEAQSAGTPVIVGDWTSMSELCFGGWMIAREDAERYWTALASYQFLPRIGAIEEALERAYCHEHCTKTSGISDDLRQIARLGALDYDADKVALDYWAPVLAEIAERLAA